MPTKSYVAWPALPNWGSIVGVALSRTILDGHGHCLALQVISHGHQLHVLNCVLLSAYRAAAQLFDKGQLGKIS